MKDNNMEDQDWNVKEDPLFDKFNKLTTGTLNRVTNIDWESSRAKAVANTDYKAKVAKVDYQAFQDKRIANTNWEAKVANTDYQARNKKLMKPISQFDLQGNFIKNWDSATQAEQSFNSNNKTITQCCRGRQKTSFGFIWKYKDN